MRHVPAARRFGIWGDDLMGYGKPNLEKKWWVDLEWVDGVLRAPRKKGKKDHD
jgi:hypothetical protein